MHDETRKIADFFRHSDASCWQEAIKLYNGSLKRGPKSKKYLHLDRPMPHGQGAVSAQALISATMSSYQKICEIDGTDTSPFVYICTTLRRYAKAIDVFIQSDPTIASLVWGSVRVLLIISENNERATRIAGEGIGDILNHASRWERISEIFRDAGSPAGLRDAMIALYAKIIAFLAASTRWLEEDSLRKFRNSVLGSRSEKLTDKLNQMRAASTRVDQEIQTLSTHTGLEKLREIHLDVTRTSDRFEEFEKVLQLVHHQTSPAHLSTLGVTSEQIEKVFNTRRECQASPGIQSLFASFTPKIVNMMQGLVDAAAVKHWLRQGAIDTPEPFPPTKGTCQWLLEDANFLQWEKSSGDSVLWIQGRGKTVLSTWAQNHLKSKNGPTLFFQFRRSPSTGHSTPSTFASSVILQLLGRQAALPSDDPISELQDLSDRFPSGPQSCPFDILWNIATRSLSSSAPVSLIIDALDECQCDGPSPDICGFLALLLDLIRATRSKALIFTRPEPRFEAVIARGASIYLTAKLLEPDLMAFAKAKYDELRLPPQEKNVFLERVKAKSEGSFKWVALVFDYLKESPLMDDSDLRLVKLLPTVSDYYDAALKNSQNRMSQQNKDCRQAILLMTFKTQRSLQIAEVGEALGLKPWRVETIISDLCKPLVTLQRKHLQLTHCSVLEFFELKERTCDRSLGFSFADADELLASKCLSALLEDRYANLDSIGSYLRANYEELPMGEVNLPEVGSFYNYASRYWDYHVTCVKSPSQELLRKIQDFILSHQFAFWSEYSQFDTKQLVCVSRAFTRLKIWKSQLPRNDGKKLDLDKFFTYPYQKLISALEYDGGDRVLPWIAQMSLGTYYFTRGYSQSASRVREKVCAGLQALLGPRHPLCLRARGDLAYGFFYLGKMRRARILYQEIFEIQRKVLGEDNLSTLETLVYRGQSEYFMSDFLTALLTLEESSARWLKVVGPDSWQYLGSQWWYGKCLAQLNELQESLRTMQFVVEKRRSQYGLDDTFAYKVQVTIGEVYRLLGQNEESIANLQDVAKQRRATRGPSEKSRIDVEIALGASYYAGGRYLEAMEIVKDLEKEGYVGSMWERLCQVTHLKARLIAKQGSRDEGIRLLQSLIIDAEPDQNNRTLLWIRLDVADLLRERGKQGDEDQASANFDNILRDISGGCEPGFPQEPDPPRILALAERVIGLVRARKYREAQELLEKEQVDWVRPSDLWLFLGDADLTL